MIGGISDMTCFSFYATKTITTGEGGMITTDRDDYAAMLKTLRLHGISHDAWNRYSDRGSWMYDVTEIGFKYNMSDISAALGISQLARYKDMWIKRKRIAEMYSEAFKEVPRIGWCQVREGRESAWYLFPIILDVERLTITRDDFILELRARGITCSVHFIPLHMFSYYKKAGYRAEQYPNAEWAFPRTLSLPIYPGMTVEEVRYVADNVIEVIAAHAK
jgi:perosamine synthetase